MSPGESGMSPGEATTPSGSPVSDPSEESGSTVPGRSNSKHPRQSDKSAPRDGERRVGRGGSCHVEIEVASRHLTVGESAAVDGSLTCPIPAEAAEQTIAIYQHTVGTPGFLAAGAATAQASGAFLFTTEALEANSVFYARASHSHSHRVSVKVAPLVTISGPPAGAQLAIARHRGAANASASTSGGDTVTFSGTISPDQAGAPVVLQREGVNIQESWSRLALGVVGADGKYSITHRFTVPGTANVRVVARVKGMPVGISETLSYEVSRRQNPQLTIQASPELLTSGESVTLSGIAAGPGGQSLTLLASTDGHAFAPVATATSESDGSYAFSPQSPPHDTRYKVSSSDISSTTLFEGVKPALKASAPPESAPGGEPLVFTGEVSPGVAGQVVDLERQNPGGFGFHVVEVGALEADGSFSIEHIVSGSSIQAFRVKVPGTAELEGVASELFTVQVTHADTTLGPEAPAPPLGES